MADPAQGTSTNGLEFRPYFSDTAGTNQMVNVVRAGEMVGVISYSGGAWKFYGTGTWSSTVGLTAQDLAAISSYLGGLK